MPDHHPYDGPNRRAEAAQVSHAEWQAHLNMIGSLERRIDSHDEEVDKRITSAVRAIVDDMPGAMAASMRQLFTDPSFLAAAMGAAAEVAKRRAAEQTGNAVGNMLKSLLSRWLVIGFLLLMIAKTAGIDVAGKAWAALKGAL